MKLTEKYILTDGEVDSLKECLKWLGFPPSRFDDIELCENGSAYVGLTQIARRGSFTVRHREMNWRCKTT